MHLFFSWLYQFDSRFSRIQARGQTAPYILSVKLFPFFGEMKVIFLAMHVKLMSEFERFFVKVHQHRRFVRLRTTEHLLSRSLGHGKTPQYLGVQSANCCRNTSKPVPLDMFRARRRIKQKLTDICKKRPLFTSKFTCIRPCVTLYSRKNCAIM